MFFILFIFLFTSVSCDNSVSNLQDEFQLSLVHFNDFHARFEETSKSSGKCTGEDCIGGVARLFTAIKQLTKERPDSVVLNAGDSFQGTLWYTVLRWEVVLYFMNLLPLDAHTLGNHEFDHDIGGVTPYLQSLHASMLVSNMDASEEPFIQKLYSESKVIERNGRKIGIIGVILSTIGETASMGKLKLTDEVEAVKRVSDKLTSQGVNIIIVLSHCGIDVDRKIAQNAGSNIDIIVGGHSHTLLYPSGVKPPSGETASGDYPMVVEQSGHKVLIVQASAFTKYLGDLRVYFDVAGEAQRWEGKPIYLDQSIKQDENMVELLQPFKDRVDAVGEKVIGFSKVKMDPAACEDGECNIGNFINDAFVDYLVNESEQDHWTYAAASLMSRNSLGIGFNIGDITYEDLVAALPYSDYLHTLQIDGKYLLEAFEFGGLNSVAGDDIDLPAVLVSGFKLVYNISQPVGKRLQRAEIRCHKCTVPSYSPIQHNVIYRIATHGYLANGGNGFSMIAENKQDEKKWGQNVDILEKYIKKRSPIVPGVEGRIQIQK